MAITRIGAGINRNPAAAVESVDAPDAGSGGGIVGGCVSVTLALSVSGLTFRAIAIIGLAVVAMLLVGWRKPAKVEPRSTRGSMRPAPVAHEVVQRPVSFYHRPNPVRRVLAFIAANAIAVLIGVITTIVLAFGAAFAIIQLTNMLGS